jgi:N6-L-threonylcarbamoyladenine synthase
MTNRPGLDFSFSGLKTFTKNTLLSTPQSDQDKADIALAFQQAVAETLTIKCKRALEQTQLNRLVIAGGVSANTQIRAALKTMTENKNAELFFPRLEFCTDNGAMIAYAGCQRLLTGQQESLIIEGRPRWPINELNRP